MRVLWIIMSLLMGISVKAQQATMTVQQAVETAMRNNGGVRAAELEVEAQRQLKKTSIDLPKTNVSLMYGQYNSFARRDNNVTATQSIPLTVFGSQRSLNNALVAQSEFQKAATENELAFQVKQVYYEILYLLSRESLLKQQDTLYQGFFKAASLRYKTGESTLLEQATAETQLNETKNQLAKNVADLIVLRTRLKTLLNSDSLPGIDAMTPQELRFEEILDTAAIQNNPSLEASRQQIIVASDQKKVERAKAGPDIIIGAFSQTLIGVEDTESGSGRIANSSDRFTGFQAGLAIPLWFVPHQGRLRAAEYNRKASERTYKYFHQQLTGEYQQAYQNYLKNRASLHYYKQSALPNADLIIKQAQAAFRNGEASYAEYLLGVQRAISVKEGYIATLNDYNQSIIYLAFLSGNK